MNTTQQPTLTTFDSGKEAIQDVLRGIASGKIQLPDFQRGWVWDDDHIKSLLASISLAYPIGAIMLLETGNPDVRLKPRLVEEVDLQDPPAPDRLILDGQQRLTSLYQALASRKPAKTQDVRKNPIERWYYLDIRKALDPNGDRDEAIVSIPKEKVVRNFRNEVLADYSTIEKECAAELFPLSIIFDIAAIFEWQRQYTQADPSQMTVRTDRWNRLWQEILQIYQQYQVPVIQLRKATPKVAVCQVFEKVNTGGVSLTVFELLTATYAVDDSDFKLREDWQQKEKRLKEGKNLLQGLKSDTFRDSFLQTVTLLASRARRQATLQQGTSPDNAPGIGCKRKDILKLTLNEYRQWAEPATRGFEEAARFLHNQHIFAARDIPYQTQLVPLAAILTTLGDKAEQAGVRNQLARWYWCGVFGELYGSAIESRFARDLAEVVPWITSSGSEPDTISSANFAPGRLLSLRSRNSAAYKGIYALLMREGGKDFRTGETINAQRYFSDKIDIHHIFPQDWCKKQGIEPKRCDSVINKTPLSKRTNIKIGGNAPSVYLPRIEKEAGISQAQMDDSLRTHLIDPAILRSNDFDKFFQDRESALLDRIQEAMGKRIAREVIEVQAPEPTEYQEEYDEEAVA